MVIASPYKALITRMLLALSSLLGSIAYGAPSQPLASTNVIQLATIELPPYTGSTLPHHGAFSEIITAAFANQNYHVEFQFYPLARAKILIKEGQLNGVFPVSQFNNSFYGFKFSNSLPTMHIGLLYRKQFGAPPINLKGQRVGVVRGSYMNLVANEFTHSSIVKTNNQEQSLLMLEANRIDYAVMDKFVAADLMVDKYPHLIGQLSFSTREVSPIDFYVGFHRSSSLPAIYEAGFKAIEQSGELEEILYRHGLLDFKGNPRKKVLRIGVVNNADMLTMRELSKHFEASHPDIELSWRILDENTLRRRLLSDLAVGDGHYDVMSIGAYETPIWGDNRWLTPINRLPTNYDLDDLITPIRASLTNEKGILYALPFYGESSVTYYRKDLFKKHNLVMPNTPNYSQISEFARILHQPQGDTYSICLRGKPGWGENIGLISTMVNAFGGQWFDHNWQTMINTQPWYDAVSTYLELLKNYGPPSPIGNGYKENLDLFAQGKCAMWIDASVAASTLFNPEKSRVHNDVAFVKAPIGKTAKGSSWLWIWSLAVPAGSQHNREAQEFIAWATSKEYIELVAQTHGWLAAPPGTRYSTYTNKNYQKAAPFAPMVIDAIHQIDPNDATLKPSPYRGIQFVAIPEFPALGTQVGQQIGHALTGDISLDQALKGAQKQVEETMTKSGYR
jgi:sorbitol/mannitol transport system substrate-binding protein